MKVEQSDNTELALVQKLEKPNSDVLQLDFINNSEKSIEVLTKLVGSKKLGKVVKVEEAIAYYVKAKELGLPFISSIDHMFDVSGKTNVDVHIMRAMVLRAGVVRWEEVYNYAPLYKYIDSTNQVIATGIDDSCLPNTYEVPKGKNEEELKNDVSRIKSIGKTPIFKALDRVSVPELNSTVINYATKYKFVRQIKLADNKLYEITEYGEFSMAEAIYAGLAKKVDSAWFKYTRNMLEHRAWTFGARKIADDILFGLLERTEYLDMNHIDYDIQDGRVEVQKDNQ